MPPISLTPDTYDYLKASWRLPEGWPFHLRRARRLRPSGENSQLSQVELTDARCRDCEAIEVDVSEAG